MKEEMRRKILHKHTDTNEETFTSHKQERTDKQISNTRRKDFSSKAGEMK